MKRIYFILAFLLLVAILFVSYFFYWFKKELAPVSQSPSKVSFVIPKGKSASEIGAELYSKGLIKNKLVFKLYVQFLDKSKKINAGEFELSSSMSIPEIVSALGKGPKELWVTIPEGLRREEVANKIVSALNMEEEKRITFINQFLNISKSSEGYLFPDTYLFPKDATAQAIYDKLTSTFDEKYASGVIPFMKDNKYSKREIVTMASILERETKSIAERSIVAGILWKRIENEWPLQVDATVQFAVSNSKCQSTDIDCDWWPVLTLDDLNINSLYNTYKYKGLPPDPICNPGLASLEASANPQESEYWFYIHSPDGEIHYAKTAEEHALNVRKYLGK